MGKKTFNNPALAFINTPVKETKAAEPQPKEQPEEEQTTAADPGQMEAPGKPPKGYKINPMYVEVKSQRVQLVLQPSVVKRLKKAAAKKKLSMNEAANTAIIEYLGREGF